MISYSTVQGSLAERLHERLKECGCNPKLDHLDINSGDRWREIVTASAWVRYELSVLANREKIERNMRLVLVYVGVARDEVNARDELEPLELGEIQSYHELPDAEVDDEAVAALAKRIHEVADIGDPPVERGVEQLLELLGIGAQRGWVVRTGDRKMVELVPSLVDVVAVLDRFPALAGVTLTVRRGEIVLLTGPNGAGKTTLLRLCAGLVPPARVTAIVLGLDLAEQRQLVRSRVGLLGHSNGLYADLTVTENVEFWGGTVAASTDEVAASLDRMGLAGRLSNLPVRKLSAGQQRRTALACLIARRAELWLLDEPHAGLDATGRDELDTTLRAATAAGATMIVASHELDRAGALATRVVEVVGGQIRGQERGQEGGSP